MTSTIPEVRRRLPAAATSPLAWVLVATVTALLIGPDEASPWWWTTPGLLLAYAALWLLRRHSPAPRLSRAAAVVVYAVAGLAAGAIFEAGLTVDGSGVGGLHEDTLTSHLLLPGYLVPAVAMTLLAVRRFGLDARQTFFVAGGMCWMEALVVGGPSMLAAPWAAPLAVALYVGSYAVYNGALGVLLLDPGSLHAAAPRPTTTRRLAAYSVVTGGVAWLCFGAWSLVVFGPLGR